MVNANVGQTLTITIGLQVNQATTFYLFAGVGDYDSGTGSLSIGAIANKQLTIQPSSSNQTISVTVPNVPGTHDGFAFASSSKTTQSGMEVPSGTTYDSYVDPDQITIVGQAVDILNLGYTVS